MSARTMARCYSGSRLAAMPFLMPDATHSRSGAYRLTLKGPNHFVHVGSHPRPLEGAAGAVSRFLSDSKPKEIESRLARARPVRGVVQNHLLQQHYSTVSRDREAPQGGVRSLFAVSSSS